MRTAKMIRRNSERGSILIPVMLVIFLMGTITVLAMGTAGGVSKRLSFKVEDERLVAIGEAVLDLTIADLWSGYLRENGGEPGHIAGFRTYLDGAAILADQELPTDMVSTISLANRETQATLDSLEDAVQQLVDNGSDSHAVQNAQDYVDELLATVGDKRGFAGAYVHDLSIIREDSAGSVLVRVRATVSFGPQGTNRYTREIERAYYIAGREFRGFDYGVLANNVNCIMCHANFDTAGRYYNSDPDKYGTFGRVRIGTLESMMIRADKTDSNVAGSIYTRGTFLNKDGTLIASTADTDLTSVEFTHDGLIKQDVSGEMTPVALELAAGDPLPANKSLYRDYPTDEAEQVDGSMPDSFPPIIPDNNNNGVVDDDELDELASMASGTLKDGLKTVIPAGLAYSDSNLPAFDHAGDLGSKVDGSLILVGTEDDPLRIDGRIVVDGDLVIVGVVQGAGEIVARGNVYIVGPLLYADGTDASGNRTYGSDAEGNENRLMLGAGGNIMVGDFLMTKKTMNGDLPADDKIDLVEAGDESIADYLAQQVKVEEKLAALEAAIESGKDKDIDKAQDSYDKEAVKLDGLEAALPPDYFADPDPDPEPDPEPDPGSLLPPPPPTMPAPGPDDPREVDPRAISGDKYGLNNFTASELTLFNRMEWTKTQQMLPDEGGALVTNPLYIEGYQPRYYTVYEDNPVYAYNYDGTYFSAETGTWLGKEHISGFDSSGVSEFPQGDEALAGANISSLMPNGRWLTDTQLINFWNDVAGTVVDGTPFELDAVLYSNNATMFLARKATVYGGQAIVNGGLIGADLGVLVPGDGGVGLQLNYDMRHVGVITIRNDNRVVLIRGPRLR